MAEKKPLEKTTNSLFDSDSGWKTEGAQALGTVGNDELVSKRMSVWAVVSTAIAVLSILAFMKVEFTALSAVAILFGIFAFITIGRSGGEISGKTIACVGLALGIATAVGGPVRAYTYRVAFEKQADQFCRYWFEQMKSGEIEIARSMSDPYWSRPPILSHDDKVGYWIRAKGREEEMHHMAHSYLADPVLLTLATLGERAKISRFQNLGTVVSDSKEETGFCYAVTVDPQKEGEKRQTFFLKLFVERTRAKTEEGEKLVGLNLESVQPAVLHLTEAGTPDYKN